jgi:hypothetical protein
MELKKGPRDPQIQEFDQEPLISALDVDRTHDQIESMLLLRERIVHFREWMPH